MFERLSDRLTDIFGRLTGRGTLSDGDIDRALAEIRRSLLDADVALPAVRSFIDRLRHRARGHEIVRSVTPGQMVVKLVHDQLVDMLGGEAAQISLNAPAPVCIMLVGLQGSGKTTSCAKIARYLQGRGHAKIMMASLDTARPAAQEQLRQLGLAADIDTLPVVAGQGPQEIAERALKAAKFGAFDVVLLDTAGRTNVDDDLMDEMAAIAACASPHETILVADALTGRSALEVAQRFHERAPLTGIMLTRMDGDGRGGAALSMRSVTGCPVKLIGTGEKLQDVAEFHPGRMANRILGMGDIVSLVEQARQAIDEKKAEDIARRFEKGRFNLDDMANQLQQLQKMGGASKIMGLLPGVGKIKKQMQSAGLDDRELRRQLSILSSMTPLERARPEILKSSRKKRVAAGAGVEVSQINKLLKMHRQLSTMARKMKGGKDPFGGLAGAGGLPDMALPPGAMGDAMSGVMPGVMPGVMNEAGPVRPLQQGAGTGGVPGHLPVSHKRGGDKSS